MSRFALSPEAVPAKVLLTVHLQILSPSADPPAGGGWLHEVKHDGHRLVVIVGGDLKLISRNGTTAPRCSANCSRSWPGCRCWCCTARSPCPTRAV